MGVPSREEMCAMEEENRLLYRNIITYRSVEEPGSRREANFFTRGQQLHHTDKSARTYQLYEGKRLVFKSKAVQGSHLAITTTKHTTIGPCSRLFSYMGSLINYSTADLIQE